MFIQICITMIMVYSTHCEIPPTKYSLWRTCSRVVSFSKVLSMKTKNYFKCLSKGPTWLASRRHFWKSVIVLPMYVAIFSKLCHFILTKIISNYWQQCLKSTFPEKNWNFANVLHKSKYDDRKTLSDCSWLLLINRWKEV